RGCWANRSANKYRMRTGRCRKPRAHPLPLEPSNFQSPRGVSPSLYRRTLDNLNVGAFLASWVFYVSEWDVRKNSCLALNWFFKQQNANLYLDLTRSSRNSGYSCS